MTSTSPAAFTELDWRRLDTFAILFGRGLTTLLARDQATASAWLAANGYQAFRLDFSEGISPVVLQLGQRLGWESEFGYTLAGSSRNLDALRDGFDFKAGHDIGQVLELTAFDKAHREDARWAQGFLSIISEHSLRQLALGNRFFALLLVEDDQAEIIGTPYDELSVTPVFHWHPRQL